MPDTLTEAVGPEIADPYSIPIDQIDVSAAELYRQNKHGAYFKRLRDEDPVHVFENDAFGRFWSITRYDDIVAVDSNHKVFSSHRDIVIGDQEDAYYAPMFIAQDPPLHDVQRKAAQPAVAPSRLGDIEALIRQRVNNILDDVPVGEPINWVEHVSKELTTQMLATLFDFPFEDRHLLPYWSDVTTNVPSVGVSGTSFEERHEILTACLEYFARLWQERAAQPPKFDFISLMAHDPNTKDMLKNNPMELLGNLMLLIVGGNDTTRNSISGGVVALNQFPDQYQKLTANPSLVPSMVSEIIRYQTPLAHMRRTALEDVEFQGKTIKKGEKVIMWYVSGNRDERQIHDPDQFIIDRDNPRRHLSFGFGIHRCMGNRVGEMQLRLLWEEILRRFDRIELIGEPERVESNFVLGYSDVPVIVHAK